MRQPFIVETKLLNKHLDSQNVYCEKNCTNLKTLAMSRVTAIKLIRFRKWFRHFCLAILSHPLRFVCIICMIENLGEIYLQVSIYISHFSAAVDRVTNYTGNTILVLKILFGSS